MTTKSNARRMAALLLLAGAAAMFAAGAAGASQAACSSDAFDAVVAGSADETGRLSPLVHKIHARVAPLASEYEVCVAPGKPGDLPEVDGPVVGDLKDAIRLDT